jgi:hypothetical protein
MGISGGNLTAVEKPPGHRHFSVRENQFVTEGLLGVFAAVQPLEFLSALAGSLLRMLLVLWHQLPCSC